jgi:PPM family protein phosphatase
MDLELEIGYRTDVGRRRDHNEDCLGIYEPDDVDLASRRGTLLVVADGMGGYAAGEVASRTAVEAVLNSYYEDLEAAIETSLTHALIEANRAVIEKANAEAANQGMGTTMAVAVVLDDELAVTNVGDSRVYLVRKGHLNQISQDHSWVAQLLANGKITPEEARRHPMRNVVTRSLGGTPDIDVDVYPRVRLQRNDAVLLCSDGLWSMVPADQIQYIVESRSAQAAADALVAAANEAGGHDNITAIVCRVLQAPDDDDELDMTEQLDPVVLQDTQPMPRVAT